MSYRRAAWRVFLIVLGVGGVVFLFSPDILIWPRLVRYGESDWWNYEFRVEGDYWVSCHKSDRQGQCNNIYTLSESSLVFGDVSRVVADGATEEILRRDGMACGGYKSFDDECHTIYVIAHKKTSP